LYKKILGLNNSKVQSSNEPKGKLAKNENNYRKNSATFTHLSALTQYFIPFEILFSNILDFKKDESEFVDYSGKQILNFQKSFIVQ
jgi:uncharacterized Tic20 family protein